MFFLCSLIEAAPLALFLLLVGTLNPTISHDWLQPYLISSGAVFISTSFLIVKKKSLNPIFVGINLYLISGSIGLLTHLIWLNQLYGQLQATGMLAWVLLVGMVTAVWSSSGFIGIYSSNRKKVVNLSWLLLIIVLAALIFSLVFQGNKIVSEYIPFVVVFTAQRILRVKATVSGTEVLPGKTSGLKSDGSVS